MIFSQTRKLQYAIQFVYEFQTEILQPNVVDAILVVPRDNMVTHDDNLSIGVVDAKQRVGLLHSFLLVRNSKS